MPPAPRRSRIR